jgi:N-acetylneuraminic acid mutarotase
MGAATLGGVIHLVGGDPTDNGDAPSKTHRSYDPLTESYTGQPDAPDADQFGICLIAYEDAQGAFLYSFGGWVHGGRRVRRYDSALREWSSRADCPNSHSWGFACALVDGVVYLISGSEGNDTDLTDRVDAYDIASNTWSSRARFPDSHSTLTGAAVGTKIYVVGRGSHLDIYDTEADSWSEGPAVAYNHRWATALAHDGNIYVFGGGGTARVDRLTLPGLVWTELPPMSSVRSMVAAASVGREIHIFGGFNSQLKGVSTHQYLFVP